MNCPACKRHDEFVFEENTRVWRCDRCHERFLMKPRGTNEDAKEQLVRVVATNADRIRAMPDAELAALFIGWQKKDPYELWCSTEHCPGDYKSVNFDCTDELLASCIVRWLRQPVEDAP